MYMLSLSSICEFYTLKVMCNYGQCTLRLFHNTLFHRTRKDLASVLMTIQIPFRFDETLSSTLSLAELKDASMDASIKIHPAGHI